MPEPFAFDLDASILRHRESYKWAQYPDDVLPLWVADMDFAVAPSIIEKLHARLAQPIGYHPLAPKSRLNTLLRAKLECDGIVGLPEHGWIGHLGGVVPGLYAAVVGLTAPGDEVLTLTPIYPPFLDAVKDNARVLKTVPLVPTEASWRIDFDALERTVSPATRLLMLCNPHNPSGRVWTRDELTKLSDFAARHRLWVVSDELHSDLALDGRYTPFVAAASEDVKLRTVTVTGPCKAYNTAGLGIGIMVGHHAPLVSRLKRVLRGISAQPAALAVAMWEAALEDDSDWLASVLGQLRSNRAFLAAFVREQLPGVIYRGNEATYLAFLDYRQHPRASDIHKYLLKTAKVALNNGRDFGEGFDGFVRLNFATSRTILADALERLAAAHTPTITKE